MKLMVIAGHPADMFDHCGGTLLHHTRRGDEVVCVSLTQGLRIHDEIISDLLHFHIDEYTAEEIEEMIEERKKVKYGEAVEACKLFGIDDVRFVDYDDEILTINAEMISRLAAMIREIHPDMVITHWPYQHDGISDHHAVTGQLALAACTAAAGVNYEDRHPACRVAQVAFMLCPWDVQARNYSGAGRQACASYLVDVTDVIEEKVKSVNMMKSQAYNTRGYAKKITEEWNGTFGQYIRVPYAEAFAFDLPEVGECLPLGEHRLWLANGLEKDHLRSQSGLQGLDVELDEVD